MNKAFHHNQTFFCILFPLLTLLILVPELMAASQARETSYKIGAGDIITLTIVAGGEEQAKVDLVVSGQGYINVPFIGKMKASNLTVSQLESRLYIPLEKDYFFDPQVHIRIKEHHSLQFFISGAVKSPGMFELDFYPSIMELIAKAGGVLPDRGNIAYILKGNQGALENEEQIKKDLSGSKPVSVDLLKLLDEGDMSANIKIKSGETVYIPLGKKLNQSGRKIYVEGRVKNPDVFDFQPGLTALSAVIMAGGFSKYAAPNRTRIIRKTGDTQETIKIDLEKIKTGDLPDFSLKPGDRIHVPESWL